MHTTLRAVILILLTSLLEGVAANAGGPDLAVVKTDAGILAVPGEAIIYSLDALYVSGAPDLEDLIFTETVPEHTTFLPLDSDGWNCLSTLPGSTCVFNAGPGPLTHPVVFAVLVDDPVPAGVAAIVNSASLETASDPDLSNNQATISTPFVGPDLALAKSDGGVPAALGEPIVYALDASYVDGSPDSQDLVFTETVPAHTTYLADLSDDWNCLSTLPGSTCVFNAGPGPLAAPVFFAVEVAASVPPGTSEITNTGSLATGTDPDLSNNEVTIQTPFAGPDLALTKSDGGITALLGFPIVYTLTVSYVSGDPDSQDLVLNEIVPDHTTFLAEKSDAAWNCLGVGAGSACVFNAGPGPLPGPVTFAVLVDESVPPGVFEILNTAVLETGTDPDLSNNTSSTATPLTVPVELMTFNID